MKIINNYKSRWKCGLEDKLLYIFQIKRSTPKFRVSVFVLADINL